MALLLDLANIVGGFVLASGLLARIPGVEDGVQRARGALDPFGWIVGVVALVTSAYWILVHITDGPRLFHFEIVGLIVGVALLWERITGRSRPGGDDPDAATGVALLVGIFGVVAIIVGLQGLFTPDG
jgi:hypothetical protein